MNTLLSFLSAQIATDLRGVIACYFFLPVLPRKKYFFLKTAIASCFYFLCVAVMIQFQIIWYVQLIIKFLLFTLVFLSGTQCSLYTGFYLSCFVYDIIYLCFQINCLIHKLFPSTLGAYGNFLLSAVIYLGIDILFYFLVIRRMFGEDTLPVNRRQTILALVTIIPFLFMSNSIYAYADYFADSFIGVLCCVFIFICCTILLYLERATFLHNEMVQQYQFMQHVFAQRSAQYELSKETIDIINRKCHDMKHQLSALQHISDDEMRSDYINQVKSSITIYDSLFHTGNETLDTLLSEKGLVCQNRNITIKCIADAAKLDFMNPVDLYTLFGNALDNAMEYVSTIQEPERRIISIEIREKQSMLFVSIENFLDEQLDFQNGLPVSTKNDNMNHGFGTKSIRYTVEKYHGHMTISATNHMFTMNFLFSLQNL